MSHFYRVRALVDSSAEEFIVLGKNLEAAMVVFENIEVPNSDDTFGSFGIDVAMVHRITFGETGPVFEDVTHLLSDRWARTSFTQTFSFYPPAIKEQLMAENCHEAE